MKLATLALSAAAAAALAFAPVAHASSDGYLALLSDQYGFHIRDAGTVVALGYQVCVDLQNGRPRERIADDLYDGLPGIRRDQADGIALAAQRELCPQTAE
ncbi:hypothetical protein PBI_KESHU_43 [Mycobacterium phage Keshu]|uniref:DUF732 domain-containing protein n=1 Tax=Mycobacterium phage Keshu TaxID=1567471 RepID=A0A0B5A096_9CAUD|nr:hypothetical protein PBI_KESHU_43 [Mycobacterium phage Keshu]AJD82263.1 hypothetical protein PBI_KESHU_43 [Mycobacterium phage Keshu]